LLLWESPYTQQQPAACGEQPVSALASEVGCRLVVKQTTSSSARNLLEKQIKAHLKHLNASQNILKQTKTTNTPTPPNFHIQNTLSHCLFSQKPVNLP
jgi:hypothetical protein